jgi:O-antigen/teichoic acid export membrane protein
VLRKNISFTFIEKFTTSIIGALISLYFINYLGPEKYGVFSYLFSLVYLFGILTFPGINNIIIKYISQGKNSSYLISASFYLSLFTSLLAFIIMLLFISYKDSSLLIFAIFSSMTIFNTISSVFKSYYTAIQKIDFLVKINLIIFFAINSIKLLAIYFKYDFLFFFQLTVLETVLQILLLGYFFFKGNSLLINKKIFKILKIITVESFPLFLTSLVIMLYIRIDQVMIEYFVGFEQLGQYSTSVRLVDMVHMFSPILLTSLYPFISKQYKKNKYLYTEYVKNFVYLFSFISVPIIFFTLLYSNELIGFIFSDKFDKASLILKILILSTPFVFWNSLLYKVLIIENMMKINFYSSLASLSINIMLNYFLIPLYGAVGASIATVISYGFFIFIIPFIKSLRFYMIDIIQSILQPIILASISLLLIYKLFNYLQVLILGIVFLILYLSATYIFFKFNWINARLINSYNIIYKGKN